MKRPLPCKNGFLQNGGKIMCKKLKLHRVEEPKPKPTPAKSQRKPKFSDDIAPTPSRSTDQTGMSSSNFSKTSGSSGTSLASLKQSVLPENPILYMYKEITKATAQFTAGRLGKSSVFKANLRGKTVAITVRRMKAIRDFRSGLGQICDAHHSNLIKVLGGCCEGDHVYLVYDYVQGSSLADCLRNSKMPGFTVLNTWISRIRIAIDVAQALEYMHHDTNMNYVHNYLKSSSIIITEPDYRARICHVGACYLAGEYEFGDTHEGYDLSKGKSVFGEITEEEEGPSPHDQDMKLVKRTRSMRITGTQGYMAPEYSSTGIVSQKIDVFAFGVILLELLAGHEPVMYVSNANRQLERVSLIETVKRVFLSDDEAECVGRLRTWIDPRLKDSYPVDCAERVARLAASCVDSDPQKRHDMRYVAGKLSKEFIRSQQWSDKMQENKKFITATIEAR